MQWRLKQSFACCWTMIFARFSFNANINFEIKLLLPLSFMRNVFTDSESHLSLPFAFRLKVNICHNETFMRLLLQSKSECFWSRNVFCHTVQIIRCLLLLLVLRTFVCQLRMFAVHFSLSWFKVGGFRYSESCGMNRGNKKESIWSEVRMKKTCFEPQERSKRHYKFTLGRVC